MTVSSELGEDRVDVDGVPQGDAGQPETQRTQLFFHAGQVALMDLAVLAVAQMTGDAVATFLQVADVLDVAPVVDVVRCNQAGGGLEDPPEMSNASPSGGQGPSRCRMRITCEAKDSPVWMETNHAQHFGPVPAYPIKIEASTCAVFNGP